MTYRSDVKPGETASRLELGPVTMWKLSVSHMHNNVYLVRENATGAAVLIDAAADAEAIRNLLDQAEVDALTAVVTTHKHWDHHRALPDIAPLAGRTLSGAADAESLPVAPTDVLQDGDTITFGGQELQVHHVPGHTPGSVVLSWASPGQRTQVWTGDTLFPGGVGATDHHEEQSFDELFTSVSERIFGRFDDADVHPGHGDDTTLATERPHLQEWRQRGW